MALSPTSTRIRRALSGGTTRGNYGLRNPANCASASSPACRASAGSNHSSAVPLGKVARTSDAAHALAPCALR